MKGKATFHMADKSGKPLTSEQEFTSLSVDLNSGMVSHTEANWRERFTPSEQAIIAGSQRRVMLTHVGAGPDYMINKLAALLDEKEGDVS